MKIVVMGVGYVGARLLPVLKQLGHEVFVTTTTRSRIEFLKAYTHNVLFLDGNSDYALQKVLEICDAMIILVAPKEGQTYEATYVDTAKRVISLIEANRFDFYLLYTSSTSVYQGIHGNLATEDSSLCPISPHSKILLEAENQYLLHSKTCILRLAGIYGPTREIESRARRLSGIELQWSGDELTNHVHVDDVVSAIQFGLSKQLIGIYNIANDDHPTRAQLYGKICNQFDLPLPKWTGISSEEGRRGYIVSNYKIQNSGFIFQKPHLSI